MSTTHLDHHMCQFSYKLFIPSFVNVWLQSDKHPVSLRQFELLGSLRTLDFFLQPFVCVFDVPTFYSNDTIKFFALMRI